MLTAQRGTRSTAGTGSRGRHRVRVPFAPRASRAIPPAAVRLRRDVTVLWTLVAAHAALHRLTHER
jgi:hypothetical protein